MMRQLLSVFLFITVAMIAGAFAEPAAEFRELYWEDLVPEGWQPTPAIPMTPAIREQLEARGFELEDEPLMPEQPEAPVVEALHNQKLKVPGFIIPIKYDDESVSEFLLVPYMGACIHVPPPPENQMVYVKLKTPMSSGQLWEPVWASGLMQTTKSDTEYATAGYTMVDAVTSAYAYEQ